MQHEQRVPFFVIQVSRQRLQVLGCRLHGQVVHIEIHMQIGRQQTDLLRVLLQLVGVPVPQMDQIFSHERNIRTAAHSVNGFLQLIHLGPVSDSRRVRFQIPLGRRLTLFEFFHRPGRVGRPHIHAHRKIDDRVFQQCVAVKRKQVERRQTFQRQNVVIQSVAVETIASFRGRGSGTVFRG